MKGSFRLFLLGTVLTLSLVGCSQAKAPDVTPTPPQQTSQTPPSPAASPNTTPDGNMLQEGAEAARDTTRGIVNGAEDFVRGTANGISNAARDVGQGLKNATR